MGIGAEGAAVEQEAAVEPEAAGAVASAMGIGAEGAAVEPEAAGAVASAMGIRAEGAAVEPEAAEGITVEIPAAFFFKNFFLSFSITL